jgi:hypothetical protein
MIFPLSPFRISSEFYAPLHPVGTGALVPRWKTDGNEPDHSLISSAEVKNTWSYFFNLYTSSRFDITDTMDIRTHRKRKHFNILEKYHIYKMSKDNLKIKETNTYIHNPKFKLYR